MVGIATSLVAIFYRLFQQKNPNESSALIPPVNKNNN
jgi:hypothetical protein